MPGKSVRNTDFLALMPRIRRASYTGYSSPSRYQTNHESLSLRQELLKKLKRNQRTTDIPIVGQPFSSRIAVRESVLAMCRILVVRRSVRRARAVFLGSDSPTPPWPRGNRKPGAEGSP